LAAGQRSADRKKLRAAARHWFDWKPGASRQASAEDKAAIAADLEALGANPAETMAEWTGAPTAPETVDERLALPAELEPVVRAFLIGATQWRWLGTGMSATPLGLDYAGVRAGCLMARLRLTAEQFDGLQIMEAEALKLLAR